MARRPLTALIWDYDGTLADTRRRNYNVVRRILAEATGGNPDAIPALRSPEVYDAVNRGYLDWRDLYVHEFGFSDEETDRLGRLWTRYQLADDTPAPVFDGIGTVLGALRFLPHGVVSANGRSQIARSLREANLHEEFRWIVGWEDVPIRRQKPEPDGLVGCLERLTGLAAGVVLYVGDHETDVRCAENARRAFALRGCEIRIVTVAACFTRSDGAAAWSSRPDYTAAHPHDVIDIARRVYDGA
jgi:phosphoglycolate phosphatase-like HAD superfamily hydrolase